MEIATISKPLLCSLESPAFTKDFDNKNTATKIHAGWWFQVFFIFTPIWGRFPF